MADDAAAARVPWIGAFWDLIDLQVNLRGGDLTSSCADDETLRLRKDDNFRLAVLFFDGTSAAVDPEPSRLRWSLRDAANAELIAAVAQSNPVAETGQSQPWFLLEPDVPRLGGAALDLLAEGERTLNCVMEVEWTIGGKEYSSKTQPVVVEFGLGASAMATPTTPTTPTIPRTPTTPTTPTTPLTPTTPPPLDVEAVRALFDQFLLEALPVKEGFVYVKDGQLEAVPGGDCTTGEAWTPT